MKKTFSIVAIVILSFFIFQPVSFAAVNGLEKADISIVSDGAGNYEVYQDMVLNGEGDLSGVKIEHSFSRVNNVNPNNLQFIYNGELLEYSVDEANSLDRYFVTIPNGITDSFQYEVSYTTSLAEGVFTTPLFVPLHPAAGKENVVTINFASPEGNIVQRNSFPILKKAEDNEVTSYMMNIPSHVNYIHGPEKTTFNTFAFVSWGSLLILLAIVAVWIRSEVKISKGVAA